MAFRDPEGRAEEQLKERGYVLGEVLGEGSYAKVRAAFSKNYNRRVAMKIINRRRAPRDFLARFLPRELEIIQKLDHPNIIKTFDIMEFGQKVFISMEIAGHGDLLEFIRLRGAIPEETAKIMFLEFVDAVDYLHCNGVTHRDLKCENILIDVHNNIKLSDFGFARTFTDGEFSRTFCGSAAYAAPEILQGHPYNMPAYDIWSMGVVLYIMVTGSMPYDDSNIKRMIREQLERHVRFPRGVRVTTPCQSLIHHALTADVSRRATIADIRASEWMAGARALLNEKQKKSGPQNKVEQRSKPNKNERNIVQQMAKKLDTVNNNVASSSKDTSDTTARQGGSSELAADMKGLSTE
ncbi:testis-specific serine/threonine-protein kinase 1 [Lingula anatina]|uniref:Testis-specific serine/threonine-protein kinase 1 n=1 Tax=Lingula anatina TaxID=7574 RepID=A0A1S3KFV3_LINAN|nr:testis-specific serine/threonine-protein kinase 1 [Lingula anatina]|eukprot:XP_013421518.1 testis-specific serine/threonine-protein kinase 1 [Lingula anatina]